MSAAKNATAWSSSSGSSRHDGRTVLAAMRTVPREEFVDAELAEFAYEDAPLPIAEGQTISQPYIVALMPRRSSSGRETACWRSAPAPGYAAAVLADRHRGLHDRAPRVARATRPAAPRELGYANVDVRLGDGTLGWPEHAPFDAIVGRGGRAGRSPRRSSISSRSAAGW